MTFTEVVEHLKTSGHKARRAEWPTWRILYVSRGSSYIADGALTVTLEEKKPDAVDGFDNPDYLARWGLTRWRPLIRDLVATDWVIS